MVSTAKLFVLGALVVSAVVLSTTYLTLSVFVERKRRAVRNRRKATRELMAGSDASAVETSSREWRFKTVRPVVLPDGSDLSLHRTDPAAHASEARTAADAHFAKAARLMPFENTGGEAGNAVPPPLLRSSEGRQDRRGADFVKWDEERRWGRKSTVYGRRRGGSMGTSPIEVGERRGAAGAWAGGGDGVVALPGPAAAFLRLIGLDPHGEAFRSVRRWVLDWVGVELVPPGEGEAGPSSSPPAAAASSSSSRGGGGAGAADGGEERQTRSQREAREALFHLERAAELGHPDAQYALANALASGVLPVDNTVRRSLDRALVVPSDFSEGGPQLARAVVLWHAAAMEGHVEAAVALGFRHRYSAMGGRHDTSHIISDGDLLGGSADGAGAAGDGKGPSSSSMVVTVTSTTTVAGNKVTATTTQHQSGLGKAAAEGRANHPAAVSAHYGVLGTCESAAAYYEAAANAVMDEVESSPLRGKANPMLDKHRLAEIHMHGGASSVLHHHNKPDELEEALQYYRLRASPDRNSEPDVSAAYTLANFYHYGMRGVKQDMKLALKYYEVAAEGGSWEAAGQAGKFYLWGMGVDEEGRDLLKAYEYFRRGSPGGVDGCTRRLRAKRENKKPSKATPEDDEYDDDEYDEDDGNLCDHPCVNGMGLLHLMGVPKVINPNPSIAKKYFTLARDMGNMDASYNLAMMSLGWMDGTTDLHGDEASSEVVDNEGEGSTDTDGQAMEDSVEESETDDSVIEETQEIIVDGGEVIITVGKVGGSRVIEGVQKPVAKGERVKEGSSETTDEKETDQKGTAKKSGESKVADASGQAKDKPAAAGQKPKPRSGPSKVDYSFAFRELVKASQKGHMQAKHKLGQMLVRGVRIPDPLHPGATVEVVTKNCQLALNYYRDVVENGPTMSGRTRAAYKQYVAGEYESALRNYLAAAEAGSAVGQINAAFLLERGHCLGMSRVECMRASVRLWRAAARQGNEEACLRVGDFYYYGRLQEDADDMELPIRDGAEVDMKEMERRRNAVGYAMGPFPWVRYVIYPEDAIPVLRKKMVRGARWVLSKLSGRAHPQSAGTGDDKDRSELDSQECPAGKANVGGVCLAADAPSASSVTANEPTTTEGDSRDDHLAIAAQYYRRAAEEHESPRANFNLGFMHEWGLGLSQDFPLAKRHYDLAASTGRSGEAELAVSMALMAMDFHEKVMRAKIAWEEWQEERKKKNGDGSGIENENSPSPADSGGVGHPVPPSSPASPYSFMRTGNAQFDIVLKHLFSWETVMVIFLSLVLTLLIQRRLPGYGR